MRRFGFFIVFGLALLSSLPPVFSQCYPGLGDCSTNQPTPSVPPQQTSPAAIEYYYVGPVFPPDPWLALRSEPSSTSGYQIMQMPEGTLFVVLGTKGKWYKVQLRDGRVGWAHSNWVRCCKSQ
jgi:hypothetical protein